MTRFSCDQYGKGANRHAANPPGTLFFPYLCAAAGLPLSSDSEYDGVAAPTKLCGANTASGISASVQAKQTRTEKAA